MNQSLQGKKAGIDGIKERSSYQEIELPLGELFITLEEGKESKEEEQTTGVRRFLSGMYSLVMSFSRGRGRRKLTLTGLAHRKMQTWTSPSFG